MRPSGVANARRRTTVRDYESPAQLAHSADRHQTGVDQELVAADRRVAALLSVDAAREVLVRDRVGQPVVGASVPADVEHKYPSSELDLLKSSNPEGGWQARAWMVHKGAEMWHRRY
jgi:hypothetical protein